MAGMPGWPITVRTCLSACGMPASRLSHLQQRFEIHDGFNSVCQTVECVFNDGAVTGAAEIGSTASTNEPGLPKGIVRKRAMQVSTLNKAIRAAGAVRHAVKPEHWTSGVRAGGLSRVDFITRDACAIYRALAGGRFDLLS